MFSVERGNSIEVGAATDVGSVRSKNEDSFGLDETTGVLVVCDGVGGAAAGEVASRLAVQRILSHIRKVWERSTSYGAGADYARSFDSVVALNEAIQQANEAIQSDAVAAEQHSGMGSTVVAVRFENDSLVVAHLGDSRAYLLRDGNLHQLTKDHTLAMEQVRRGFITEEQARNSPVQNIITRGLGTSGRAEPEISRHAVRGGDVLLLCTDGLWRFVAEDQIKDTILHMENAQDGCDSLVRLASQSGSDDNITCLLARIVGH